jgi:hypothetical protein
MRRLHGFRSELRLADPTAPQALAEQVLQRGLHARCAQLLWSGSAGTPFAPGRDLQVRCAAISAREGFDRAAALERSRKARAVRG